MIDSSVHTCRAGLRCKLIRVHRNSRFQLQSAVHPLATCILVARDCPNDCFNVTVVHVGTQYKQREC